MQPVTLAAKAVFRRYYGAFPQMICEGTFAERFLWAESREHRFIELEDHLIVSFKKRDGGQLWYAPVGSDPAGLIRSQMKPSDGFSYRYVPESVAMALVNEFAVTETPENHDYVYDIASLRTLEGKPYAEKRNFINRARKHNPEIVRLSSASEAECIDLLHRWAESQPRAGESTLKDEESALSLAFRNFEAIDLFGIGIRINAQLEAVSFGCPLNQRMFVEYFEKATSTVPGLYPLAVHELAKALPANFTELNLEEDLGIPGLKTAKERWNPIYQVKKYEIVA